MLAGRQDLWFAEFIEHFLGITDERIQLMCRNDHDCALIEVQKEFARLQQSQTSHILLPRCTTTNESLTEMGTSLPARPSKNANVFDFIVSDTAQEYRRRATMSMHHNPVSAQKNETGFESRPSDFSSTHEMILEGLGGGSQNEENSNDSIVNNLQI